MMRDVIAFKLVHCKLFIQSLISLKLQYLINRYFAILNELKDRRKLLTNSTSFKTVCLIISQGCQFVAGVINLLVMLDVALHASDGAIQQVFLVFVYFSVDSFKGL